MQGYVPPDPEGGVSKVQFAVVYAPRVKRHRFSANCVNIVESAQAAIDRSDSSRDQHAAKVLGPSKSSEGQFIYYLVEWLNL
jgi:hypothetical protein